MTPGFSLFLVTGQHVLCLVGPGCTLPSKERQSCHFTHHSKSVDTEGGSLKVTRGGSWLFGVIFFSFLEIQRIFFFLLMAGFGASGGR